jgi:uncharacterized protein
VTEARVPHRNQTAKTRYVLAKASDSINTSDRVLEKTMKSVFCGFAFFALLASTAAGQTASPKSASLPSPVAPAAAVKIDPGKEADIRRLLELTGAKALAVQTMNDMSQSLKPVLTNSLPPGDYREKLVNLFFAKFMAKADTQTLVDLAVPEYDKNFTREEILGLIQFYQTPLGKKSISLVPQLTSDLQQKGRKWGETLGRQCMMEVLAEHPEFEKEMADAQKATQSKN